jgi:Na+-translocating ferredoxin:NAD+ oxidoreductase subunit A
MQYLILLISSVFINNIVLTQLLGISPLMTATRKVGATLRFSMIVAIVLVIATILNFLLEKYVMAPLHMHYYQIVAFVILVLIVCRLVHLVLLKYPNFIKDFEENFFVRLVTNSTILGTSLLVIKEELDFLGCVTFAFGSAIGFVLVMVIFSAIQEQLRLEKIPKAMQGYPILLIAAGLLAMAFIGLQ